MHFLINILTVIYTFVMFTIKLNTYILQHSFKTLFVKSENVF